jgi:paraquat-inducible protein B
MDLELSADGFSLRTGSLESLIAGGVEFDTPETELPRREVTDHMEFTLYDSRRSVEEVQLKPRLSYLLMFTDSVRGLSEEAPVEFRGIRVGTVTGISFDYARGDAERRVPVLIRIDPGAIGDAPVMTREEGAAMVADAVKKGLRATLKTGSMLTGQLFVNLKLDPDAEPAEVGMMGKYPTLPTASSGLSRLEDKLALILDKIEKLPVEDTLNGATETLAEIRETAETLDGAAREMKDLLASEEIRELPARINTTLAGLEKAMAGFEPDSLLYRDLTSATGELRDSLRSIKVLADSIDRKPNSMIFGRKPGGIQPPSAKQ